MKKKILDFLTVFVLLQAPGVLVSQPVIIDSRHYSNVFGETRNYRIFLPHDYYSDNTKRYPVIYYYHGWSQRYFGSTSTPDADEGNSNGGDNIANFVASHDVIVVKADGYNRRPVEEYYLRPYNVLPVETYRQFPLYFPELITHIDRNYRTIPDRGHRAITGLSMGGFMTFWLGGKYPHLVCAAGSFCGSPEFVAGPRDLPVEYRHMDMAGNYEGVKVRLNFGNRDFIRCYHLDLNRVWTQMMDNYEYRIYDAEHVTCGLGEMFSFFMDEFSRKHADPSPWNHTDVYPEFDVWDYSVSSDRERPGFTVLENVSHKGFRCSVREFLPDGELMQHVKVSVITAPLYESKISYTVSDWNGIELTTKKITSDNEGRLKIDFDGGFHEIGISEKNSPLLIVAGNELAGGKWAVPGKESELKVSLFNPGAVSARNVTASLSPVGKSTRIIKSNILFGEIRPGEKKSSPENFSFIIESDSAERVRFRLTVSDAGKNIWHDHIDLVVRRDVPDVVDFIVADGRIVKTYAAGDDTTDVFLGTGNGDGITNPGESIAVLVNDNGIYRRAELLSADSYVNRNGENIRLSDNWADYDHVGGSAKYSIPIISSDCPDGHVVDFIAAWWLPAYPDHIIREGRIRLKVTGKDNTPPVIRWLSTSGDNTVQAKITDGSDIKSVKVVFTSITKPESRIEVILNDAGTDGDVIKGDRVYSKKAEVSGFGRFRASVTAVDVSGNSASDLAKGEFILH